MVDVWVTMLLEEGKQPRIVVIEQTDDPDAREMYWIAKAKEMGVSLLNRTSGGKDTRFLPAPEHVKSGKRSPQSVAKQMKTYRNNKRKAHQERKANG
jgi:hypothetical protein